MASMVNAVEANLFAFFPLLARWPRAEAHDDPDMIWTLSDAPYPLFNSICRARVAAKDADEAIRIAMARCARKRVPMLWWTGPQSEPADLEDRLIAHGFYADYSTGMAVDLERRLKPPLTGDSLEGDPSTSLRAGGFGRRLSFDLVRDAAALKRWCAVLCEGFGAPIEFGDAFAAFALAVGLAPPSPLRHYLASIDGAAVGTASIFNGAGVAGIYDVSTLPSHRRQGIGAAITRAAMRVARDDGHRMAILHSSAMGNRMYQSVGFKECCRIGQFVYVP